MAITIPARKSVKKTWPSVTITNPGMGLNNVISDEYIQNEEASDLLNIQYVEAGNPAKRNGYQTVGSGLGTNPKGLASFYPTIAGVRTPYLLTIDGTALSYLNGSTWTTISGASFTTGKNTTFVQCRDELFIWNGTEAGAKLTSGLVLSRPTTTVSASFGIFFNSRQIVAGVATQPNRLYISNSTDSSDFTVATGGTAPQPDNVTDAPGASVFAGTPGYSEANLIDVSKNDGDRITGLAKLQNAVIIFKERSIYQLTFGSDGTPTITLVNAAVGCVSHRSIDTVENDIFFLSRNGYYSIGNEPNYFQVFRTKELSVKVHPTLATITSSNLGTAASIFYGYVFYGSIATGGTTTNNTTLTFDRRYGAWSKWNNVSANSWTEFIDSTGSSHLYLAADNAAQVYEIVQGTYSDNGTAIAGQWTSKAINFGDISLYKRILYIDFEFRQIVGSVTLNVYTDGGTLASTTSLSYSTDTTGTVGSEMWGDPVWGGSSGATTSASVSTSSSNIPYRLPVNKEARTVKVQISNGNLNETFVFLGMKIFYRPYDVQKFPSAQKLAAGTAVTVTPDAGILTETGDYIITE
jgi:hypothetical protein